MFQYVSDDDVFVFVFVNLICFVLAVLLAIHDKRRIGNGNVANGCLY